MKKRNQLGALVALVVALSFTACATIIPTIKPEPASQTGSAEAERVPPPTSENWTRISQDPFSFVPRGMPEEAPTDHLSGEWLQSQDGSARWFVPKGGFGKRSEKELRSEAYSMRSKADESSLASKEKRLPAKAKSWGSLLRPLTRNKVEDEEEQDRDL